MVSLMKVVIARLINGGRVMVRAETEWQGAGVIKADERREGIIGKEEKGEDSLKIEMIQPNFISQLLFVCSYGVENGIRAHDNQFQSREANSNPTQTGNIDPLGNFCDIV
ncbi:hypothetical protein YC2023_095867 [Brassica napus]